MWAKPDRTMGRGSQMIVAGSDAAHRSGPPLKSRCGSSDQFGTWLAQILIDPRRDDHGKTRDTIIRTRQPSLESIPQIHG